jgi:hypothetical protein
MGDDKLRSGVGEQYTDNRLQANEGMPINTRMEARTLFRRYRESVNAELPMSGVSPRIASTGTITV